MLIQITVIKIYIINCVMIHTAFLPPAENRWLQPQGVVFTNTILMNASQKHFVFAADMLAAELLGTGKRVKHPSKLMRSIMDLKVDAKEQQRSDDGTRVGCGGRT